MEALLQDSKRERENALERETISNILRMNEQKKRELLANTEIPDSIRNIEIAYLDRLHDYWLNERKEQTATTDTK